MTMCKTLIDLFEKQGGDRAGCHFVKAQAKSLQRVCPNILTSCKRKHCSSTGRCLARKSDEEKVKDEQTSEKKYILPYFPNNTAKKAVKHEGQH